MVELLDYIKFLREACIRVQVPDPDNEMRQGPVIMHSKRGIYDFYHFRYYLRNPGQLIKIVDDESCDSSWFMLRPDFDMIEFERQYASFIALGGLHGRSMD